VQCRDGGRQLVLHVEQPRDEELRSVRVDSGSGERDELGDPRVRAGNDEHGGGSVDLPGRLELECGVVGEDRALQPPQPWARLEPEPVAQFAAGGAKGVQRLGLAAGAVQGEHALGMKCLAVRMLGNKRVELGGQPRVPATSQIRLDAGLERCDAQLVESFTRDAGDGIRLEVDERIAAPERQRFMTELGCAPCVAPFERVHALRGQSLEAGEVELVALDPDPISRGPRLDSCRRPEEPSQLGDVALHLRDSRDRRPPLIQLVCDPLHRDDAVRLEQQDRERRALLRAAEGEGSAVGDDLEWPEDPILEHRPTVAPR
jgi:hypothetical protein